MSASSTHLVSEKLSFKDYKDENDVVHLESQQQPVEEIDDGVLPKYHNLPPLLQGMTQDELHKLDRRTTLKIDLRLMPMLILIYILNYLDRNNIASARLGGIEKELGMHGSQWETVISILFVGYITMQIPANLLLEKFGRPSIFIAVVMTLWSTISACTAAVQSYGGLIAIRVLLGIVEAGFFPAALLTLSQWYDRKSLTVRNAVLYSGSLLSSAFSGLIAAGILLMDGQKGISGWRWLFIIEGCITVFIVPFAYFILPDVPSNTKFLSEQERDLIMWKLAQDTGSNDSDQGTTTKQAPWLAFTDIKVWMVTGILSFLVAACGVTNFFPTFVGTLGYSRVKTLCMTAPPYCCAVVTTFFWSLHADKTGERLWHILIPGCVAMASFIITAATLNIAARYFAMCIMLPGLYCAFVSILSWMSNCTPRPPAKRAVAIALMNCLSNSTSIWNAYLYPKGWEPRFEISFICNCVFLALLMAMAIGLSITLRIYNKRIENGTYNWERELGKGHTGEEIDPDFRFLY